jgi:hypothetical protein
MNKTKIIPKKNYIILVILSLITVLLTLYVSAWMKTYKDNKLSVSPFSDVVEEVNINEINLAFSEMNEVILYVGYTNDKTVYDMEERLIKYIKSRDIVDKFIYVNVTDFLNNNEYLNILKNTFEDLKDDINDAPSLIYVKNGKAEKVINSNNKVITTYDIISLTDEYKLEN